MRIGMLATGLLVLLVGACGSAGNPADPADSGTPTGPADWFIAATGSDTNDCREASPCLTFNRGYQVAAPGQIVEVAAGTYAAQRIDDDPSKDGGNQEVLIRAAAGASVT